MAASERAMSAAASPLRDRMIFIVGARRSGTNWLQRVIGAHPEVALVPSETYLFSRGVKPLRERLHHGVLGSPGTTFVYMDPQEMAWSLRELCDRVFLPFLRAEPRATRLVERTPEHVTCLDLIGEIYPDGRVLHIVRDGRDVARSLIGQPWGTAPGSIAEAAEEWRSSVEAGESAGASLAHYRTIRYEHLSADPRGAVAELFDWLGLRASAEVVEAALLEARASFNEDPKAPGIAEGKWREQFTEADLAAFMTVAGDTLVRLGYAAGTPTTPKAATPAPRGLRQWLRGGRRAASASRQRDPVAQLTKAQQQLDRVVSAVLRRNLSELRELANPALWVRVAGPGEDWKGRGDAAWEKLGATLDGDGALDGRQVAGDLHAGLPTSTAVLTFVAEDGSMHLRTLAVSFQSGAVSRLTYYRFPLGEPPAPRS